MDSSAVLVLGYCPQFDAHFDQLTGREHLNLYARIKGIPEDQLDALVDAMLDSLKITEVRFFLPFCVFCCCHFLIS